MLTPLAETDADIWKWVGWVAILGGTALFGEKIVVIYQSSVKNTEEPSPVIDKPAEEPDIEELLTNEELKEKE